MKTTVKIESNAYGGDGLARLADGRVCFVRGAFEGDVVCAELTETKRSFARAEVREIIEPSPNRLPDGGRPRVPGAVYAPVSYEAELRMKTGQLQNFLDRIRSGATVADTLSGRPLNYRNKAAYGVQKGRDGALKIGYRAEFSHDVVDTDSDPLACEAINKALPAVRSGVRALLGADRRRRRFDGEDGRITVRWTPKDGVRWCIGRAPAAETLTERTRGLDFKVPLGGFYQVNPQVGEMLADAAAEAYLERCREAPHILDLYCGVGVFGLCCADAAAKAGLPAPRIVGVESSRESVACAKDNASAAGIKASFFCERVESGLSRMKAGPQRTVIADPPRGGMEPRAAAWLARSGAGRIFYVSCDPATLARDLRILSSAYRIARARLFDMFPGTARFETFVELEKRDAGPSGGRKETKQ